MRDATICIFARARRARNRNCFHVQKTLMSLQTRIRSFCHPAKLMLMGCYKYLRRPLEEWTRVKTARTFWAAIYPRVRVENDTW